MSHRSRLQAALQVVDVADIKSLVRESPELSHVLHAAVKLSPPALERMPKPWIALKRADMSAQLELAHALTEDVLEATRDALGDAADEPTVEQLREVLDALIERFGAVRVTLLLAVVAAGAGPAADACDEVLDTDERLALDEAAPARPVASTPAKQVAPEVKDQRKARREEQKAAKAKKVADAARAKEALRERIRERSAADAPAEQPTPTVVREVIVAPRAPAVTPSEARRFDIDHALVMAVVIATVRFYGRDPDHPELDRKQRPCVVVGVAKDALLVRPGYSDGGMQSRQWQSHQLRDWSQAGLDGPTWIETKSHIVRRNEASEPLGYLTVHDWNALW